MEMERQRQTHSKEIESKDEEVDEIRRSCNKKVGASLPHSHRQSGLFTVAPTNKDVYSKIQHVLRFVVIRSSCAALHTNMLSSSFYFKITVV